LIRAATWRKSSKTNNKRFGKPHDCRCSRGVFALRERSKTMKPKTTRTRARQQPRLQVGSEASFRAAQPTELERLKERLLQELLAQTAEWPDLNPAYRRAANDAVSLAWVTPFPLLFLPVLVEEKAAEARQRTARQRTVLKRTAQRKAV